MLFMEEYHQATMEMLGRLSGELDQVGELTSRAAAVIKAGGTAWTSMDDGHMPGPEQKGDRRGNPGILRNHNGYKPATFDAMQKGDMVFTNQCNRAVQRARDRGVYVVAVTVNYVDNEFRPERLHQYQRRQPDAQGCLQRDSAQPCSLLPGTGACAPDSRVHPVPLHHHRQRALHWMLTAETANKVWTGSTRSVKRAPSTFGVLTERVDRIRRHQPSNPRDCRHHGPAHSAGRPLVCAQPGASGIRQRAQRGGLGTMIINWGDWEATRDSMS